MNCVLVTGSSGFVGSAVCEELALRGIATVGFDRSPSPFQGAEWVRRLNFVQGDLRDVEALSRICRDYHITEVVHAAALTPDEAHERSAPDLVIETNVAGACRVMMAARTGQVRRVILLSSISAYGAAETREGRFDEAASHPDPQTLYGISKWAAEQSMRRLATLEGTDLRIIRLGPLFGPWEHASGARAVLSPHHQIAEAALTGRACVLPRPVPADWLYSRQAARRVADVLLAADPGNDVFNLGGGVMTSLVDWCRALTRAIPGFEWKVEAESPTIRYGYAQDRPPLDNRRIDGVSPDQPLSLVSMARDHLAWLDRFCTSQTSTEFHP